MMGKQHWPIHPQPQADELLSSWMIRVARDNGFKVHNFYADHFGRERQIWNRDIDHHAPDWLLDGLAAYSGLPHTRLQKLTLRSFESIVFERLNETGNTRFLMPLSIFHRTRRAYGQQFCPLCLATDKAPYLRRRWRLALVVLCVRHGVLLQDRCGSCGRPLAPHRSDMSKMSTFPERSTIRQCGHCRESITASPVRAEREALEMQQHIDCALDKGFALLSDQSPVYSHLYFDGLRQMMAGLATRGASKGRCYSFEHATIGERLNRLQSAVSLVDAWPSEFLGFCARISKPYTVFTKDVGVTPYWLASVLRRNLFAGHAKIFVDEAEAISAATEQFTGRSDVYAARLLSGRSIERALPPPPSISEDTADVLIASIDHEIGEVSGSRRLLLQRDKVMFIAARCLQSSVSQLLALDPANFCTSAEPEFSFWDRIETPERAAAMLDWYLHRLRPRLLGESSSRAFFTTLGGGALKSNAVGARFTRAVQRASLDRAIPDWKHWVRKPTRSASGAR